MRKHTVKLMVLALCLLMCGAVLAGCSKKEEVVEETTVENDSAIYGTWTESYFDSGYTFGSDGTGRDTFWDLTFTYTAVDGNLVINYDDDTYADPSYSYTVNDSSLTLTRVTSDGSSKTYTYTKN